MTGQALAAANLLVCGSIRRSSVVMPKSGGKFWAERVCAFLEYVPPGYDDPHTNQIPALVEVARFADAAPAQGIGNGMADDLNCPVFNRAWQDDPTDNPWPFDHLAPCKLSSVPHDSHPQNLVVVSRFALFLQQLPLFHRLFSNSLKL